MEGLPVVVGVDGSDSALLAVDWAVDESIRRSVPLRLVFASLWERYEGLLPSLSTARPTGQALAEHIVATAAERARRRAPEADAEAKVGTEIVHEEPAAALRAAGRNASVLVTGARGRGQIAGLLLGSVSLALAATADCPVVVVRGEEAAVRGEFRRVTLAVGEAAAVGEPAVGELEEGAPVRFAFAEAAARGAELHAVRAWRCPAHEMVDHPLLAGEPAAAHRERARNTVDNALRAPAARHPEVAVRREALEGPARKVLLDAAAEADLLVVGAHRRQGHLGLQLGTVTHTLLHHAPCPVAVVPEHI
ncbi:universal stress protein [Streptomyces sp. ODS28]|uniref:universal stress protein n=1 Tax=Streptomyces sp. ODS28 TaxID=3136688 RepID=UPI0031EA2EC7